MLGSAWDVREEGVYSLGCAGYGPGQKKGRRFRAKLRTREFHGRRGVTRKARALRGAGGRKARKRETLLRS